jgi:hypothetical protein
MTGQVVAVLVDADPLGAGPQYPVTPIPSSSRSSVPPGLGDVTASPSVNAVRADARCRRGPCRRPETTRTVASV